LNRFKKYGINRVLISPFILAIPFSLITLFLLPLDFNRQKIELISVTRADKAFKNTRQYYVDLDGDDYSEEISHFSNTINRCAIKISTKNNEILRQWNFNGQHVNQAGRILITDYDNNGIKEVFTIYNRADSVFLGGINPYSDIDTVMVSDMFLDKINYQYDTIDFSTNMYAYDLDNDGFQEIIIALNARHSEQPRKIIAWNIIKDTLFTTINYGFMVPILTFFDLDHDCNPEILFSDNFGQLNLISGDLRHITGLGLKKPEITLNPGIRQFGKDDQHLVIQADDDVYEFKYTLSNSFLIRDLLICLLIYSGYVFSVWLILISQKRMLHRRFNHERTLLELKLKSIRNQMDPHFTFNAVNAIASAIYKEEKQIAYTYFSKFSKLIRSTMLYSDRMSRMLEEELDFTTKYLEIEKFRFRDKFTFQIHVDDNVDLNREVPRMIVQAFAESSIANGLMHRTENGLLRIDLREDTKNLHIEFTDNGVGIAKSKEYNKAKAFKPVKLMEQFIGTFNEFNDLKITFKMFDYYEGKKIAGTKVRVKVPLKYDYKLNS